MTMRAEAEIERVVVPQLVQEHNWIVLAAKELWSYPDQTLVQGKVEYCACPHCPALRFVPFDPDFEIVKVRE